MKYSRTRQNVAANVKHFREAMDIPVPVPILAKRLGVGRQYWYFIENCRGNISLDRLDKIAEILDVSVVELVQEPANGHGRKRTRRSA